MPPNVNVATGALPGMLQGFAGAILMSAVLLLVVIMAGCSNDKGGVAGFCDNTPPLIISISPACGATGVVLNQKITVTFNEGMDSSTFTATTFTLAGPSGTPVSGTVAYVSTSSIATFTPASSLTANTAYTYTVKGGTTGVKDRTGNALANDFACNFTTGAVQDVTPPTVISTDPANNATGVALNKIITATFSEAMDPSTITTTTVTLETRDDASIGHSNVHRYDGNLQTSEQSRSQYRLYGHNYHWSQRPGRQRTGE